MDRSEGGSPFTLKHVANFINRLQFRKVLVIEPHSDVTCALLDRSEAKYINYELLHKVIGLTEFDVEHDYIVFPDSGASKRYSKMTGYRTLVGHKKRDFATGEIKGLDIIGDFNGTGKKAIIVDDLSSYGGTFVHTSKALRIKGIEEVCLLVAHAENSIFKRDLFDHVDAVFTTDSILTGYEYWIRRNRPLRVYKLEEIL
jgi:ribose-phosphate pyrophosphokinase